MDTIHPGKMEGAEQMSLVPTPEQDELNRMFPMKDPQQCGKCKWWDRENTSRKLSESWWLSSCHSTQRLTNLNARASLTQEKYGKDCKFYEERKE